MNQCEKCLLVARPPAKHKNFIIAFTKKDVNKTYTIPLCDSCTDKLDKAIADFFEKEKK